MKYIQIDRCCNCGFNEHGQHWREYTPNITYLGVYIVPTVEMPGPPMLYCMYNPDEDFRDNYRGYGFEKTIWIAGDPRYEEEFDKQLQGFPDWCPLMNEKEVSK